MGRNILRRKNVETGSKGRRKSPRPAAAAARTAAAAGILLFLLPTAGIAAAPGEPIGTSRQEQRPLLPRESRFSLPDRQGHWGPVLPSPLAVAPLEEETLTPPHPSVSLRIRRMSQDPRFMRYLARTLTRGRPYRRYISRKIQEHQVPREILYLPVIESSFRAGAVSHAGAAGIWQFMAGTARPHGLVLSPWRDDRFDFYQATPAALEELKKNYRETGNWPLALAAYNCGLGRVKRAVQRGGTRDYWTLREQGLLPAETREYVPRFLAAAHICSRPARYGLPVSWKESPQWEAVPLRQALDLRILSRKSGIPYSVLRQGNGGLRYGLTPPSGRGYQLKVPRRHLAALREALAQPGSRLIEFHRYAVQYGDTLSEIAEYYRIPQYWMYRYNPGLSARSLQTGQVLTIPLIQRRPRYTGSGRRDQPEQGEAAAADFTSRYTVCAGDSLWTISREYSVSPQLLAQKNQLSLNSVIHPGNTLRVPGSPPGQGGSP